MPELRSVTNKDAVSYTYHEEDIDGEVRRDGIATIKVRRDILNAQGPVA